MKCNRFGRSPLTNPTVHLVRQNPLSVPGIFKCTYCIALDKKSQGSIHVPIKHNTPMDTQMKANEKLGRKLFKYVGPGPSRGSIHKVLPFVQPFDGTVVTWSQPERRTLGEMLMPTAPDQGVGGWSWLGSIQDFPIFFQEIPQ